MPLKTYDSKDAVPEAQRAGAQELKDGKWLVEEPAVELGDAGKEALRKEREKVKAEKDRADSLEKERDDLALKAKAAEGKVSDSALAALRAEFETKLKAEKDLREKAEGVSREARKEKLFDALAIKSGAIEERLPKMKKDILDRFELNDAGDGLTLKDAKGNPSAETPEDFLGKTYKADAAFFYKGVNGSGSGLEGSDGTSGSGYDAAAAGKAQGIAERKTNTEANALALR